MSECLNCGKKLNFLTECYGLFEGDSSEVLCVQCKEKLTQAIYSMDWTRKVEDNRDLLSSMGITDTGMEHIKKAVRINAPSVAAFLESQQKKIALDDDSLSEMILSTCPSIDGYRVVKQLGLVFGECAYKTGLMKSLSATFENMGDILTAGDKELSGTSRLLESAREYAIQKMKKAAGERGANAVIGIDSESSIGGDIMHITIYGTAVALEMSKDEKPSSDRDSTPSAFDIIFKEMAGMDRSEKLVFLSDAYSKDKINYEEYQAIIKHENL